MAFTPLGPSVQLNVTSAGVSAVIVDNAPQCRIYSKGPNDCRISYSGAADASSLVFPPGLVETHTKLSAGVLYAKCDPGETASLHIICGLGD